MGLVRLYVKDLCDYCRQAKQFLRAHGIPFEELNIREPQNLEELHALGTEFVPTFVMNGHVITGFSEYRLRALLGLQ